MRKLLLFASLFLWFCLSLYAEKQILDIPKWDRFVEVTRTNVNLRMGPSTQDEKLLGEHFAKGEVAPVLYETDDWVKVYYAYSPKEYVWLSKQYTRPANQELIPDACRFTTSQTFGDNILTYKFDGKLTNIVYKEDYPFETARIRVNEPDVFKNDGRFPSTLKMDLDWDVIMPQIVKTIPDKCVYKYFRGTPLMGESHNFRTDHDTEEFSSIFYFILFVGDIYYELAIYALPTKDTDELFLVAHSQSGIDGMGTDLLTSMRYNYVTGEYSDIQEGLPGVVIDKLGLTYDIFKDTPEYQQIARQSQVRHISLPYFMGIPMVTVTGPELALEYPIDTYEIEGYPEKTTVYYMWDGEKFVKLIHSPYIDMLQMSLQNYYDIHSQNVNQDFSQNYDWLMPFFADACVDADKASSKTGRAWLDFDPLTFLPKGQEFQVLDIEVISTSNRSNDSAIVRISPMGSTDDSDIKTILIEAMLDDSVGAYRISDIKDENGRSVLQMAHAAKAKN